MENVFTPAERTHFMKLRLRELDGEILTGEEAEELITLTQRIEEAERVALENDKRQSEQRAMQMERQSVALRELIGRQEALVAYLHQVAQETDKERTAIENAFQQIVTGTHDLATMNNR